MSNNLAGQVRKSPTTINLACLVYEYRDVGPGGDVERAEVGQGKRREEKLKLGSLIHSGTVLALVSCDLSATITSRNKETERDVCS